MITRDDVGTLLYLVDKLKELGVYKVKVGDFECELGVTVMPQQLADISGDDLMQAVEEHRKKAQTELDRDLYAATEGS